MTDSIESNMEEPNVEDTEETLVPKDERPALTIVIQSWATPIAALVMLILGLVGGFFLRPVVLPEREMVTEIVNAAQPTSAAVPTNPNSDEIMLVVTQQTKHFIGNENAQVTIVEFSDYQ